MPNGPNPGLPGAPVYATYWGTPMPMMAMPPMPTCAPISARACAALQHRVNEVAEGGLMARRLLDVVYTDEPVPVAVTIPEGDEPDSYEADVKTGIVLLGRFSLDIGEVQLAEQRLDAADLTQLVVATRGLAARENARILGALAEVPAGQRTVVETADMDALLAAADAVRARGHTGPLAAVVSGEILSSAAREGSLRELQRVFAEGILPAPTADVGVHAIVLEPGGRNAHVVVGRNYALSWLAWDGVHHQFSICVSLRTVVTVPGAIQVLSASAA
jgi:hypothetical protein